MNKQHAVSGLFLFLAAIAATGPKPSLFVAISCAALITLGAVQRRIKVKRQG